MTAPLPEAEVRTVRLRVFRAPSADAVAMSFAPMGHRCLGLVEITFADGSLARGETWLNYPAWAWRERQATIAEGIAPLLVGRRFTDPAEAYQLLAARLGPLGRQWGAPGPIAQAISGVDLALWTLVAERAGRPLAELLGPDPAQQVLCYASSLGPDGVAECAAECRARGFTAVKVKLGFGRDRDAENLATARTVLGDRVRIFADANQAWSPASALELAPVLREAGVEWIEEPLAGDRTQELREFAERGRIPVATGENRYAPGSFGELAGVPGIAVVQPDLTKVGGITPALRIAEALPAGVVAPHLYNGAWGTLATLHFAAARRSPFLEWDIRHNPLRLQVDQLLDNGRVRLPTGSGLGLRLDPAELEQWEESP